MDLILLSIFLLSRISTFETQAGPQFVFPVQNEASGQEEDSDVIKEIENEGMTTSYRKMNLNGKEQVRVGDWHQTISASYDKDERPTKSLNEATSINISIWIVKIYSVSEAEMAYSVDLYFQEMWRDPRLAFDPELFGNQSEISLPAGVLPQIWQPDTYFPSARSVKEADARSVTHTEVFRLSHDGSVWFSRRLALTADCPMVLTFYPFDKQDCKLKIGTYGQTTNKLMYQWRDFKPVVFEKMVLPEFNIIDFSHKGKVLQYISGNYSSLEFCFIMERDYGFCLIQLIIPAVAVVMSSWVALWLQEEVQFSDVISVILAIIFLSYANNSTMPRVSYVKLIDLYLACCFVFVFISLGKLVLLKYLKRRWNMSHAMSGDNGEQAWRQQMNKANLNNLTVQDRKNRRRKSLNLERSETCFFACLSCFHVTTQLLLPIAYAGCLVAALVYMPSLQSKRVMCE